MNNKGVKKRLKMNAKNMAILVLCVLLVVAVGYILYQTYKSNITQSEYTGYQQGLQVGYTQAVQSIYQLASSCQKVPLTVQNKTINVADLDCLAQPQK